MSCSGAPFLTACCSEPDHFCGGVRPRGSVTRRTRPGPRGRHKNRSRDAYTSKFVDDEPRSGGDRMSLNDEKRATVDVDGAPASYLTAGDGPVVLMLHGTYWSRVFLPILDDLAAAGLRPVAVDLPGIRSLRGRAHGGDRDHPRPLRLGGALRPRARRRGACVDRRARHRWCDRAAPARRGRRQRLRAGQRRDLRFVAAAEDRPVRRPGPGCRNVGTRPGRDPAWGGRRRAGRRGDRCAGGGVPRAARRESVLRGPGWPSPRRRTTATRSI